MLCSEGRYHYCKGVNVLRAISSASSMRGSDTRFLKTNAGGPLSTVSATGPDTRANHMGPSKRKKVGCIEGLGNLKEKREELKGINQCPYS